MKLDSEDIANITIVLAFALVAIVLIICVTFGMVRQRQYEFLKESGFKFVEGAK